VDWSKVRRQLRVIKDMDVRIIKEMVAADPNR
jgi:hypothetical protein